ncbi:MAG: hypothetical protein ACLVDB_01795 [Anaeromassilibacillus sp.]
MNSQYRTIRALLSSMAPNKAIEAVRRVNLPEREEQCVIDIDICKKSCVQTAEHLHVSVDGLAKIRRKAYAKIADDIQG